MSILITGIDMPTTGNPITVTIYPDGTAEWEAQHKTGTAVPVPPHGRLADMDAIERKIRRFGDYVDFTKDEIAGWFENGDFETIIPAEEATDGV